jgi:ABC-2 type transport system permease protein
MSHLIGAELLKLRTMRPFWWSAVAVLAFVPLTVASSIAAAGRPGAAALDSSEGMRSVMSAASSGALVLLVIGILVMAGEFRHQTATSTFLITPDRKRVVGAKLAAVVLAGIGVAIAASLLTLVVAVPWLAAKHVDASTHAGDVALPLLGALAATPLCALVGVGCGALLRNQTLAVTVCLVWVAVIENLVIALVPGVGRWLPGGAASALAGVSTGTGELPIWGGAVLLAAYGLAFAAVGTRLVLRRDIA